MLKKLLARFFPSQGQQGTQIVKRAEERDIIKIIFVNFFNSLKPKRWSGDFAGKDYFGNSYYEMPPAGARVKPSRIFVPPKEKDFTNEIPAEWESWLRHRRKDPPTEEELAYNLSISQMKKVNAAKLEEKRVIELEAQGIPTTPSIPEKGMESFPKYKEYDGGDMRRHKE